MLRFYQQLTLVLSALFTFTIFSIYVGIFHSTESDALQSNTRKEINWRPVISSDSHFGGASHYRIENVNGAISYFYELEPNTEFPYVSYALRFTDQEDNINKHIDLSHYHTLEFTAACVPANVLTVTIYSFDESLSKLDDLLSYRIPTAHFNCEPTPKTVSIDLSKLEVPEWWLRRHTNLADRSYTLDNAASITLGNSGQSPRGISSYVRIENMQLLKNDYQLISSIAAILVIFWIGAFLWMFRAHANALGKDLKLKLQRDLPLASYQQLSIESHRDKERSALINYLSCQYHDPDLDLDKVSLSVGVSKTKINEILKQELGMTFVSYLNKLRLTEAARLLQSNQELAVSEAAFRVGYNNSSYFNRLFKNEYGCTPKEFRKVTTDAHHITSKDTEDMV